MNALGHPRALLRQPRKIEPISRSRAALGTPSACRAIKCFAAPAHRVPQIQFAPRCIDKDNIKGQSVGLRAFQLTPLPNLSSVFQRRLRKQRYFVRA